MDDFDFQDVEIPGDIETLIDGECSGDDGGDDEGFEVEGILDKKSGPDGEWLYYVKWVRLHDKLKAKNVFQLNFFFFR